MTDHAPYEQYIELDALTALWPNGPSAAQDIVLGCGLQSIELLFSLAEGAMRDDRPPALTDDRIERMVDVIVICLRETAAPYAALALKPTTAQANAAAWPTNASVAATLPGLLRTRLRLAFDEHLAPLPFRTGLERHLSSLTPDECDRPMIDYPSLVPVEALRAIRRQDPHGPEDVLFATAHQAVECWMRIVHHHLEFAERLCRAGDWSGAARRLGWSARAIAVATNCARLLDLMVLHDYHPLRVRLRDGSGAQSRAAQRLQHAGRGLAQTFQEQLDQRGLSVLEVLMAPRSHPDLYRLQAGLQDFGRRCQAFLFEHYLLALSVLGVNNIGSLGYPMHQLAKRAAHPFWPAVDQAKHDYVILTNLEHAEHSGAIILANEVRLLGSDLPAPRSGACSRTAMRALAREYFSCLERRDPDGWVQLFEPDGVLRDSEHSRPYTGHTRLRLFVGAMLNTFSSLRVRALTENAVGERLQVRWTLRGVSLGVEVEFSGREVFSFSDNGKLTEVQVEWNPAEVARTLREKLLPGRTADCANA